MSEFDCSIAERCSGCPWHAIPYADQGQKKANELLELLKQQEIHPLIEPKMISPGPQGLRDRVDLVIMQQDGRATIGLYRPGKKTVADMNSCPQMSPALQDWFQTFRQNLPAITKGSVRLRVAPDGTRGVWLDFANIDVKILLDEGGWLRSLMELAIVEVGQRKKRLVEVDGRLKLQDPEFFPWFETLHPQGSPIPLYSSIATFTQPGFEANRALVGEVLSAVGQLEGRRWLELFCGIGNFTLPLAASGLEVTAFEVDRLALNGLEKSQGSIGGDLDLHIIAGNAYRIAGLPPLHDYDGILVDPPRSGLKNVLQHLQNHLQPARPAYLVYVSCYTPALVQDLKVLVDLGYSITAISGVDQFPQTPHCEWVVTLRRSDLIC
ncbi:MAG: class I SAM-dependent RNA methyltransferase [Bdellovibrionaceae bacterium]|nr:class I SAM-dependent RNA methyltransferase [Bdellovibrionales bacterium]MCB9085041.1 class I SAM-dependent RNA methyltransferase [Pseudobdellovibrionaceae bacterium]